MKEAVLIVCLIFWTVVLIWNACQITKEHLSKTQKSMLPHDYNTPEMTKVGRILLVTLTALLIISLFL